MYPAIAHAVWHRDGFLFKAGALDFAGGDVVHVASGASALVASVMVGKRRGKRFEPHNIALSLIGASFLWVGWSGFNGGSALSAGVNAGFAVATSHVAAAMGALGWMGLEWAVHKKPTVLSIISGAIAGLVGITPACGFVDFVGAFVIGLTSGIVCFYGVMLKEKLGFDDALDAFGALLLLCCCCRCRVLALGLGGRRTSCLPRPLRRGTALPPLLLHRRCCLRC